MAKGVNLTIRVGIEDKELMVRASKTVHPEMGISMWARGVLKEEAQRVISGGSVEEKRDIPMLSIDNVEKVAENASKSKKIEPKDLGVGKPASVKKKPELNIPGVKKLGETVLKNEVVIPDSGKITWKKVVGEDYGSAVMVGQGKYKVVRGLIFFRAEGVVWGFEPVGLERNYEVSTDKGVFQVSGDFNEVVGDITVVKK